MLVKVPPPRDTLPDIRRLDNVFAPAEQRRCGEQAGIAPDEQHGQRGAPLQGPLHGQRVTDQAVALVRQHGQRRYRSNACMLDDQSTIIDCSI